MFHIVLPLTPTDWWAMIVFLTRSQAASMRHPGGIWAAFLQQVSVTVKSDVKVPEARSCPPWSDQPTTSVVSII